ncbi:C4-dicarboxylate ABC transporter [Senegalia massiliensis]|uniref:C4-dicarboxylate ABC transporter n=2 Tax=Senegalia massiliensis TaxID=1720316 RepID=A0A845R6N8_9CLOT|nr:C4-dicarboxylate ABC transporter [Senegalia massiliensis]
MMNLIKKLPIPICGLMLGLAALGNLIAPFGAGYRLFLGSISGIIFIMLTVKVLIVPNQLKEALNNPAVSGVLATYPMGMMILSTYIKPNLPNIAFGMWILALVLNVSLMLYFISKFIFNFNIKKVFVSYFVLFVGIVVGSVTAPAYGLSNIGRIIFWYGLVAYLPLIPIVLYRVIKIKGIPEPAQPLTIIFAAPASLLLAGYMSSFEQKSLSMIIFLSSLAIVMTVYGLLLMPKMLKLKFYPSYSAFTFPFVISAIGMNMVNKYLMMSGDGSNIINFIAKFETFWAIFMVGYVLLRYLLYMANAIKPVVTPDVAK